jgi:hypothetical protein
LVQEQFVVPVLIFPCVLEIANPALTQTCGCRADHGRERAEWETLVYFGFRVKASVTAKNREKAFSTENIVRKKNSLAAGSRFHNERSHNNWQTFCPLASVRIPLESPPAMQNQDLKPANTRSITLHDGVVTKNRPDLVMDINGS